MNMSIIDKNLLKTITLGDCRLISCGLFSLFFFRMLAINLLDIPGKQYRIYAYSVSERYWPDCQHSTENTNSRFNSMG